METFRGANVECEGRMKDWQTQIDDILGDAGWTPGRQVDISDWCNWLESSGFEVHGAFRGFAAEFGGLVIESAGKSAHRARERIEFDPSLTEGEEDRFHEWGELIGRKILPIGELDGGRFFLGIDEEEMLYLVVDWLAQFGAGSNGLDNLILGGTVTVLYDRYQV